MKDKQLSNILTECLDAIEKKGASIEECLTRHPEHREALRDLLSVAQLMRDTPEVAPRKTFKQVARVRLINRLPHHPKPVTFLKPIRHNKRIFNQSYQRRFSMNWLLLIAMVASLLAGGTGVAYASDQALPGDALYGVKNAVQNVQLAMSGDEGDVDLLLGFMGEHLEDIEDLTEMGQFQWIDLALDEYNQDLGLLTQTRERISYEDAPADEALTSRIQAEIMAQLETLLQLQTRLKEQQQIQDKLQQTIHAAENGAGYGPSEGGPPEESGGPHGVGEGEPQGEQQQNQNQTGQTGDADSPGNGECGTPGQGEGGNGTCGNGSGGNGNGQGGKP
jgi:hypothetical protein